MISFKVGENVVDRFLNEKCVVIFRYRSHYLVKRNKKREFWCKNTDLISLDNNKEKATEVLRLDSKIHEIYNNFDNWDNQLKIIHDEIDEAFNVHKTKKN